MLEFADSDLYFVQDKNNCINPLLQVGSGPVEKKYRIRRAKNHRIRPDPDPHPCLEQLLKFVSNSNSALPFLL